MPDWCRRLSGAKAKGHFERVDDGNAVGWVAGADGSRIAEPVTLWADGRRLTELGQPTWRQDLEAAGIAGGHAVFEVDVLDAIRRLPSGGRHLDVALSTDGPDGPEFFCRARLDVKDPRSLVADPMVLPRSHLKLRDWTLVHDERAGLRVDRFPIVGSLHAYAQRYTRLSLLERAKPGSDLRLRCAVDLEKAPTDHLMVGMLVRCDRRTELACTLSRDGEPVSQHHLFAETGWRYTKSPLPETAGLDPEAGRYEIEVSAAHAGRGHLDIAMCYVSEAPSLRYLRQIRGAEPDPAESRAPAGADSFLDNGDFTRWSRGTTFEPLSPGQEIADGWFIEGRADQLGGVRAGMEVLPRTAGEQSDGRAPEFGIRVRTHDFTGPVRLYTVVDPQALDCESLSIDCRLRALGGDAATKLSRIFFLARGARGREAVAHVIARRPRVRREASFEYRLSEADMVSTRRACADMGSLLLVFEFVPHADVCVESVGLRAATGRFDTRVAPDAEPDLYGFEDASIVEQISRVAGLESWAEPGRPRVAGGEGAGSDGVPTITGPTGHEAFLAAIDPITAYRPWRGYPDVDIVVPVFNALESVRDCVRSVLENTNVPHTLMLVDDGSDEETARFLAAAQRRFPNVMVVTNEENLGYTRTVNAGLSRSNAEFVCVLNSDCIVTPNWLMQLMDVALDRPNAGMVGPMSNAASFQSVPRIWQERGTWNFNPLPASFRPCDMATLVQRHSRAAWPKVRVINGFCQLIRRTAIDAVGLLDEVAFPRGFGEENDYCVRVLEAGFDIHVADDTYVYHTKSQSFGHEQRTALSAEGSKALRVKHPGVDWKEVTQQIEFEPALQHLRAQLIEEGFR